MGLATPSKRPRFPEARAPVFVISPTGRRQQWKADSSWTAWLSVGLASVAFSVTSMVDRTASWQVLGHFLFGLTFGAVLPPHVIVMRGWFSRPAYGRIIGTPRTAEVATVLNGKKEAGHEAAGLVVESSGNVEDDPGANERAML